MTSPQPPPAPSGTPVHATEAWSSGPANYQPGAPWPPIYQPDEPLPRPASLSQNFADSQFAQQYYQQQQQQPQRRRTARNLIIIFLGLPLIAGIIVGAIAAANHSDTSRHPAVTGTAEPGPAGDVTVDTCSFPANQFEGPVAALTVTNRSSETSSYLITVAFETPDGGTQLDTGYAYPSNLAPGQVTHVDAVSLNAALRGQDLTCRLANITRFRS